MDTTVEVELLAPAGDGALEVWLEDPSGGVEVESQ